MGRLVCALVLPKTRQQNYNMKLRKSPQDYKTVLILPGIKVIFPILNGPSCVKRFKSNIFMQRTFEDIYVLEHPF